MLARKKIMKQTMAEMTHINREDETFVKIKFLYKCSCTFIVEQKSFPNQTNGINKSNNS